ncbi:MAG: hypothetical protein JKY33_10730 [Bacteroidia bacterium]|nr:hypothetical protein [Bacteroidia bacterium]
MKMLKLKKVKSIKRFNYSGKVYDLSIDNTHTYNINDISVHNSSAGSLICYLMQITEVDPLEHGLLFERFIDLNRADLPDIDIDFPDDKRIGIIKYLFKKYGADNVCYISNINQYKARSAINDTGIALGMPRAAVQNLKDAIVDRGMGDARAEVSIKDTLETTDIGKDFVNKYPNIVLAERIQMHTTHAGKHAAGIIVCNEDINQFGGINDREGSVMLNKSGAEYLGLLKIDCLSLRTLTVIQDCADQIGMAYSDFYSLPTDDAKSYQVFKHMNLGGIFQFEGQAMRMLCESMGVENFDDIVSITALARPGPLHSGGATTFAERRTGRQAIEYTSNHPIYIKHTKDTFGVIIYQEQLMFLCREMGNMSWEEVSQIRKAASKTLGKEFFDKYRDSFLKGAKENNVPDDEAIEVWESMLTFGKWGMNKCLKYDTKIRLAFGNQKYGKYTDIKTLYNDYIKHPSPWIRQQKNKGKGMPVLLSQCEDDIVRPQMAKDIVFSGNKDCYRYTLSDGEFFECPADHKFLINGEWKRIGDAVINDMITCGDKKTQAVEHMKPNVYSKGATGSYEGRGFQKGIYNPAYLNGKTKCIDDFREKNKNNSCEDCSKKIKRMEAHHNDFNYGNDRPDDLSWLCSSCHKIRHYKKEPSKIPYSAGFPTYTKTLIKIEYAGKHPTYDIEMPEHHNFVLASGPITHNSHTIAYGYISYWCAYLKANHPLEFTVANLRHPKDQESSLRLLREAVQQHGFEYKAIDADKSQLNWSVSDGVILGGLMIIDGIGEKKAKAILKARTAEGRYTPSLAKTLLNPVTPFDTLYPAYDLWGHFYDDPDSWGLPTRPNYISEVKGDGSWTLCAKVIEKNLRDLNEYNEILKRGGEMLKGKSHTLRFIIADDTEQIHCGISRFKYDELGGDYLAEQIEEGETWLLLKGDTSAGWRYFHINTIHILTEENRPDDKRI